MSNLVSILIPCYNAEKWLAETLELALSQTWKNIEIILVDDGSTDGSLATAKSYESKNVKVIAQENRGASSARNTALKHAQGDFIQYLDADDLLASDKIDCQIEMFKQHTDKCVITGQWGRFYLSIQDTKFIREQIWKDMFPVEWLVCSWEGGGMMHPAAWLVPRNIAKNAGFWNEDLSLNDDGEYFCRVILASKGIKFCQEAKSYYRSSIPNSLSGRNNRAALESAFKAVELCINHLLSVENTHRTRRACATILQRFLYSIYPNHLDLVKIAEKQINCLGGSDLQMQGSNIFKLISSLVGWKSARKIQLLFSPLSFNHSISPKLF